MNQTSQNNFIAQSYSDAERDFVYSCVNSDAVHWDYVILTAANEKQADSYRMQIDLRQSEHRLPLGTEFVVISDYESKRIGSGGATLNAIRVLENKAGGLADLLSKKILMIHSGGDSKRIPQYSVSGKLFAPIPRLLKGGYISSIFDELMIAVADIPNRCGAGILILPSDTELLFNSLQVDLFGCDAAGISIKTSSLEGQDHGVFLPGNTSSDGRNQDVARFLHKQSEKVLGEAGAIDSAGQVNIDTGCIWLGSRVVNSISQLIYKGDRLVSELFNTYVNEKVCLNFYADFVYPLATESTLNEYLEQTPENGFSSELENCRRKIWDILHNFSLSLVKLSPARYIHFGMTHEMFDLMVNDIAEYKLLGWKPLIKTNANTGTVINSFISERTNLSGKCYVENSVIEGGSIGVHTILSSVCAHDIDFPDNVVMHGLKLKNGEFVCRMYGINDNPKASANAEFLSGSISQLLKYTQVDNNDIWNDLTPSIWNARVYPASETMQGAVENTLKLYSVIKGEATADIIDWWRKTKKYSLGDSFYEADSAYALSWQDEVAFEVTKRLVEDELDCATDANDILEDDSIIDENVEALIKQIAADAEAKEFPFNMRYYLACADMAYKYGINTADTSYELYEDMAYDSLREVVLNVTFSRLLTGKKSARIIKNEVTIELPARVNFCGSPSDAAPYCIEHGGTMVDGAIVLNGKYPIKAVARKIKDKKIVFSSVDQACSEDFVDIDKLTKCNNPMDSFALHKAVLISTGLISSDTRNLSDYIYEWGGGFELQTFADIPKGSGLGTSSLIAAASIQAVSELFGLPTDNDTVYSEVFLAEQLMTTGGGWQDQVGGLTKGIKYFTSQPGIFQKIDVEYLNLSKETIRELNERFVLVFSGQRRLARNVLREEMNKCIRNDKEAMSAIESIRECCAVMRYQLMKGDITAFANSITRQFELVKILDHGATNTCIDYIFEVCEDLIDGKSICGAGGGGFLQMILKRGISKETLKRRIEDVFSDCGVEVWDSEFV